MKANVTPRCRQLLAVARDEDEVAALRVAALQLRGLRTSATMENDSRERKCESQVVHSKDGEEAAPTLSVLHSLLLQERVQLRAALLAGNSQQARFVAPHGCFVRTSACLLRYFLW